MFSFGPVPSSLPPQAFAPVGHALQSTSPLPRVAPSSASSSPLSLALAAQGGDDDSSMGLLSLPSDASPFSSFAGRHSVLRRRSRAEKDDSSDDDDDDDSDDDDDAVSSSSHARSRRFTAQQHPHPHFKRVKLTSLLPLSFETAPASPPLPAFPPPLASGPSAPAAAAHWPAKPTRSRSLGDCSPGRRSSASLDSSPPFSPTVLAAAAGADAFASPVSASSPSASFSSTFPTLAPRRSPLKIIPPSSIARVRSVLPFSPRSHSHSQYLLPPTVNHSPRASLPLPVDASSHPLESLFTRLTMQEPLWLGKEGREGKGERGFTHAVRQEEKAGRVGHRRSLSVVLSPAAAAAVTPAAAAGRDRAKEVKSPLPSPPSSSWLVRVDSVDDMHDAMASSASAAVASAPSSPPSSSASSASVSSSAPSVLTGSQMIHFFHQLRLHESDWTTLALAWRWRCGTGGLITREEFVRGMQSMGCLTLEQLEAQVRRLRAELEKEDNSALYKEFFHFVFNAVRSAQPSNRRTIHVSTALGLLQSLLMQRYPAHMLPFTRFLSSLAATRPTTRITFDQWASLLDWCFPELDTRVLTNWGLLFLDQIEALQRAGHEVLFGCYAQQSKALLYRKGRLVFPQQPPPYLLEFTSAGEDARWAEGSGDYGTEGAAEENPKSRHVSLRVTPHHGMYVQLGNETVSGTVAWSSTRGGKDAATGKQPPAVAVPHRKVQAQALLSDDARAYVRMLACAEAGYAPQATSQRRAVQRCLHLNDTQFKAFLELLGFWLGDSSLGCIGGDYVRFEQGKKTDVAWLRETLEKAGLKHGEHWTSYCSGRQTTLQIAEPAWFDFFDAEFGGKSVQHLPAWTLQELSAPEMRLLISGLHRADGAFAGQRNHIFTSSARFRDQVMQALLHCGYSAYARLSYRKGAIRGYNFHNQSNDKKTCGISFFAGLGAEEQLQYWPVKATADAWKVSWAEMGAVHNPCAAGSCRPSMSRQQCVTSVQYDAARDGRTWCVEVEHKDHLIIAQRAHRGPDGTVTKQSRPIVVGNCQQLDAAYLGYEEEGSWPVLMDDFIEWMRRNEPETMRRYEERRREREQDCADRANKRAAGGGEQQATQAEAAGDTAGISRSVVEEMRRMRVDGSSAGMAQDRDEAFMPDAELSPQRRSSLRVRVPRLANIDAVSLDSDDHRHHQQPQLRHADSAKLYLSRSLPSLPSLDARLSSSPLPIRGEQRLATAGGGDGGGEMSFGRRQTADVERSISAAVWDDTGMTD